MKRPPRKPPQSPEDLAALRSALQGVVPLRDSRRSRNKAFAAKAGRRKAKAVPQDHPPAARRRAYVTKREPDWHEGYRVDVGEAALRKLRSGRAHAARELDLHGMREDPAIASMTRFLQQAKRDGVALVRVIHGRGLHSRGAPVLREAMMEAILLGQAGPLVLAFSTCSQQNGGAGATLLCLKL